MSLYYLIASLPMLRLDAAPPATVTPDAFLEACRAQLGAADAAAAEALVRGAPSDHPFARAWAEKETVLRNAVARERARLAGTDASRWLRPAADCDAQVESLVEDAFQARDPLSRERALDKARWLTAEALQGPDPLSVRVVLAYALKLALVARWTPLARETGERAFETLARLPNDSNPEP